MPTIKWDTGDGFYLDEDRWGVALTDISAVFVKKGIARGSYTVTSGAIPDNAMPMEREKMPFQVQMALAGALACVGVNTDLSMGLR